MLALSACSSPKREAKTAEAAPLRDVPNVMRGIIGAEADIRGIEPVLVSGLGVVVGLNGTGGGELPVQVQATMERELSKGGIGKGGAVANTELGGVSPQQFLRSPDVAVVIVQAAIPPGAPKGAPFDVFVRTLPGSSVTSLEGGTLWTTELRLGQAAVFGAVKTRRIAEARGSVFINPFSAPSVGPDGGAQLTRTIGRVLGGGRVTEPLKMEIALDNDSHARARSIVSAINSRFPPGPDDEGAIARGRGSSGAKENLYQSIALTVPHNYRDKPADFLQLIRSLRVDSSFPQEYAKTYVEELKNQPGLSNQLSWMLQAVGKPAVPFLASMYDYPEFGPRMAALEAGAKLGDQRAVSPLIDLAKSGPPGLKTQAIKLLGEMPANPSINLALRELLSQKDLDVRIAAYEGLRARGDAIIQTITVGSDPSRPKFSLDLVPEGEGMIYVTQQGQARVVVFGASETGVAGASGRRTKHSSLRLNRPLVVRAWDDRLMLAAETPTTPLRLYYREPRSGQVTQTGVSEDLIELILFMTRRASSDDPAPGLGFGYSDVVGALYEMSKQGGIPATFATEDDRLRAEIFEASRSTSLADRPEGDTPAADQLMVFKELEATPAPKAEKPTNGKTTRVVPLTKPKPSKGE